MTTATATELAQLDDGEMTECGRYRLRIEPDYDTTFEGEEFYGQVGEWLSYRHNATAARPSWADGRARKVHTASSGWAWWQPPSDVTDDVLPTMRRSIEALGEYGWNVVGVELLGETDYYGKPIVKGAAWSGAVENSECFTTIKEWRANLADIIGGLLGELGELDR